MIISDNIYNICQERQDGSFLSSHVTDIAALSLKAFDSWQKKRSKERKKKVPQHHQPNGEKEDENADNGASVITT